MRSFAMYALFAILLAGTLVSLSTAQSGDSNAARHVLAASDWQWQQGGGLPYGDYQQTCRNIRNNGYRLDATCQKRSGNWRNTSLNYRDCQSSIVNDDGRLRCAS